MRAGCTFEPTRIGEIFFERLARRTHWSPIGDRVAITIDDSADERLTRRTLYGTVRGHDVDSGGMPSDLIIELDEPVAYVGHFRNPAIHWLVARSCFRWRRTNRLLLTWAAVRVMDAPSLVDATYDRTIGTARVRRV